MGGVDAVTTTSVSEARDTAVRDVVAAFVVAGAGAGAEWEWECTPAPGVAYVHVRMCSESSPCLRICEHEGIPLEMRGTHCRRKGGKKDGEG